MKFDEYFKLKDLTINITNDCNMKPNCVYCFEKNKSKENMTKEMMKTILDKCYANYKANNPSETLNISLFGGEPFVNWDVIEYAVKYSKEKDYNISFGITTNLLELTDHMLDVIEEYEIFLLVSIDGTKETHNRNRSNSFDVVENNIKRLMDRGLKYLIEARMTVMPNEVDLLLDGIKTIFDMGIDNIAPVIVTDTEWKYQDFEKLNINLEKVWDWVISVYNDENNKRNLSVKLVEDFIEKIVKCNLSFDFMIETCHAGTNTSCSIGVNGEIMPCHQRHTMKDKSAMTYGNILEDDIHEIKFNDKTIKGGFECNECPAKTLCKGGCLSENYTINGNSNKMNETQCLVYIIEVMVAMKKQEELLYSKKIRSHRLNVIKENLKLYDLMIGSEYKTVEDFMKIYEKIIDLDNIILPHMEVIIEKWVSMNKKRLKQIQKDK